MHTLGSVGGGGRAERAVGGCGRAKRAAGSAGERSEWWGCVGRAKRATGGGGAAGRPHIGAEGDVLRVIYKEDKNKRSVDAKQKLYYQSSLSLSRQKQLRKLKCLSDIFTLEFCAVVSV